MSPGQRRSPAVPSQAPSEKSIATDTSSPILPADDSARSLQNAVEAFVIVVLTPEGKYRRRVYLSLHSASHAVERAWAKGQPARMILCRVTPVPGALVNGAWSL